MRFLHTSDWHLGKLFFNHSLIEDQKFFLDQIIAELKKAADEDCPYDALIVAGDVYDKAIPAPEAVPLFSDFLNRLHENFPALHMFFTSGNHDSASRLSFASDLLHSQNIHIVTDANDCDKGVLIGNEKNDDAAIVYQIPFLQIGSLTDEDGNVLRHQEELVKEACCRIKKAHDKFKTKVPSIISAHIFATNCSLSGSERNFVGTAEQVDAGNFADFDYTALGHIHGKQKVGAEKICYSGSPLAYNFGEKSDKVMLSVTLTKDGIEKKEIPFKPLHSVTRLEGSFEDFLGDKFIDHKDDYLELICTDSTVHENPIETLRGKYPYLLSFRVARNETAGQNMAVAERKKALENIASGDYGKLFDLFITDVYKNNSGNQEQETYGKEKKLFSEIAKEAEQGE
ncbi:MAG: exonuclease SbcCD subunit D [Treponema sp.]|nr:exonuclease subunit SbcD [Spirochaetia bacterium]MDD7460070.1 exonuclease SbcCD subunit D [Spirochaetales bacterium]MDY5811058.1 exonuclease SbcCD subunit D [Treponema sp.]MEE1182715.1 exonuclease SbcCD subunit D [Treponema sp.]